MKTLLIVAGGNAAVFVATLVIGGLTPPSKITAAQIVAPEVLVISRYPAVSDEAT
jgi:hypothetical protein